jgi:ribosomal protein S18 acetylase RimI-like enzyme
MEILNLSKSDFDKILSDLTDFWGNDRTLPFHHPIFLYEFANTAFVIKEGETVIAYLLGLISQTAPVAYVHLIGVRQTHKRQGHGRRLYDHFIAAAVQQGCKEVKAITTPTNVESIAFHKRIGMRLVGNDEENGVPVVKDYSGPGQHRVVFSKIL